jgi:hypothetical protein
MVSAAPSGVLRVAEEENPPPLSAQEQAYQTRRAQALEEGQGELEESQRAGNYPKPPGYAEGEMLPDLPAQQRIARGLAEEPRPGIGEGREDPLWRNLWRQREIARIRPVAKQRSI